MQIYNRLLNETNCARFFTKKPLDFSQAVCCLITNTITYEKHLIVGELSEFAN